MGIATRQSSKHGGAPAADRGRPSRPRKALTIGAVCKILGQEFDEVSISKIRYLEDQKLLSPARTAGGYRLYSQSDVERLRAILRMQRDEFLPLRVIRQELSSGARRTTAEPQPARRRGAVSVEEAGGELSLGDVLEQTRVGAGLVRELEEYGLLHPGRSNGEPTYDEADLEIVRAAGELARFGVEGRNLRGFVTSADREAALIKQILAPGLRSRSKERRRETIESLEGLATVCTQLRHQLLVQELRRLTE